MKSILICNIEKYKHRTCFDDAANFLSETNEKILVLYGLRRTGKTTLMKQLGAYFGIDYIYEVEPNDTMKDVYALLDNRFQYKDKIVFIDEITNAKDFAENSALLADYYAACGMNIVITGTDSLGLFLAEEDALLDRVKTINTTYISFAEHCATLGTDDLNDYIQYGGLMSKEIAKDFLKTPQAIKRYLDSSVSFNIAHSIHNINSSTSYTEILKYSEKDIGIIIRKIVDLYNGTIQCNFLNSDSSKTSITAPIRDAIKKALDIETKNLYKSLDRQALIKEYKDIINISCQLDRPVTEELITDLTNVLFHLNFLSVYENRQYDQINGIWMQTIGTEYYIIQPAIKYALLKDAQNILMNSPILNDLSESQKNWLSNQIENDIFGQMTENIVIYEITKYLSKDRFLICKPYFKSEGKSLGEYDMLVYDKQRNSYDIFEIKHSSEIIYSTNEEPNGQDKHLLNPEFMEVANKYFGEKHNYYVLYNGETKQAPNGTNYINVSEFLLKVYAGKSFEAIAKDNDLVVDPKMITDDLYIPAQKETEEQNNLDAELVSHSDKTELS